MKELHGLRWSLSPGLLTKVTLAALSFLSSLSLPLLIAGSAVPVAPEDRPWPQACAILTVMP